MSRTHYNNGDEIALKAGGCDGCSPVRINGRLSHEHGCPDAWRDRKVICFECGASFHPEIRPHPRARLYCPDCRPDGE